MQCSILWGESFSSSARDYPSYQFSSKIDMLINPKTLISISFLVWTQSWFVASSMRKWEIEIINCFILDLICKQPTRICLSFLSRAHFVRADNIDKFARPDTQRHHQPGMVPPPPHSVMCQHPQLWTSPHDICLPSIGKNCGTLNYLNLNIILRKITPVYDRFRYGQT